jgi:hypothetical protein
MVITVKRFEICHRAPDDANPPFDAAFPEILKKMLAYCS